MTIEPLLFEDASPHEIARAVLNAWVAELRAFAREYFPALRQESEGDVVIHLDGSALSLQLPSGLAPGAPFEHSDGYNVTSESTLSSLADEWRLRAVLIEISPSDVLRPVLKLPNGPARTLHEALRYELERQSPIDPKELYFDHRVLRRDDTSNTVEVELRVVRKAPLDKVVDLCRTSGLAVAGIRFDGDRRWADWSWFPVDRYALAKRLLRLNSTAFFAGLAVFLVLATGVAAYSRGSATLDALTDATADAGIRAARIERMQSEIAATTNQLSRAAREKQAPLFVDVLAAVTDMLPDGTWLTDLSVDGTKVRVRGFSSDAAKLSAIVERSRRFTGARLDAQPTRASGRPEALAMSFDLVTGPAP